jgi:hypothetical protein
MTSQRHPGDRRGESRERLCELAILVRQGRVHEVPAHVPSLGRFLEEERAPAHELQGGEELQVLDLAQLCVPVGDDEERQHAVASPVAGRRPADDVGVLQVLGEEILQVVGTQMAEAGAQHHGVERGLGAPEADRDAQVAEGIPGHTASMGDDGEGTIFEEIVDLSSQTNGCDDLGVTIQERPHVPLGKRLASWHDVELVGDDACDKAFRAPVLLGGLEHLLKDSPFMCGDANSEVTVGMSLDVETDNQHVLDALAPEALGRDQAFVAGAVDAAEVALVAVELPHETQLVQLCTNGGVLCGRGSGRCGGCVRQQDGRAKSHGGGGGGFRGKNLELVQLSNGGSGGRGCVRHGEDGNGNGDGDVGSSVSVSGDVGVGVDVDVGVDVGVDDVDSAFDEGFGCSNLYLTWSLNSDSYFETGGKRRRE